MIKLELKKVVPFIVVILVIIILTFYFLNTKQQEQQKNIDLIVPNGVIPDYINVFYTNGGFHTSNLKINKQKIVFRNMSDYAIILKEVSDNFWEGTRVESGSHFLYEFEGEGSYIIEEQKSGLKLDVSINNIDYE